MIKELRKYLAGLLVATLIFAPFPAIAFDQMNWAPQPVVYRGTVTGLLVSASSNANPLVASGGAFVDGLPQAILDLIAANPAGSLQFDAYSSTGLLLRGVLKAAGSAEGLDSELVDTWTNHPVASPFEILTLGAGNAITQAVNSTGTGVCYKITTAVALSLYKLVATVTKASGTSPLYYWGTGAGFGPPALVFSDALVTTTGIYKTALAAYTYTGFFIGVPTDFAISGFSLKKQLAPSSAGATIVSAKSGATYNWAVNQWVTASYNAASYTVIVRALR